jgi:hypothetical protein
MQALLYPETFEGLQDKEYRPDYGLQESENPHPESRGLPDEINGCTYQSQTIYGT